VAAGLITPDKENANIFGKIPLAGQHTTRKHPCHQKNRLQAGKVCSGKPGQLARFCTPDESEALNYIGTFLAAWKPTHRGWSKKNRSAG
jgi:hypothetical protein